MRKLPRLYLVMLRYRVAAMVALFMLLGAAQEGRLEPGLRHLLAALALASSYVSATALNDLADEEIDRVNHPRDAGRPLVEGAIQPGPQSPSRAIAGQHVRWTAAPRVIILMAASYPNCRRGWRAVSGVSA